MSVWPGRLSAWSVVVLISGERGCRDGKPYVYGYVPIVVAKCGMFLKDQGESGAHLGVVLLCYDYDRSRTLAPPVCLSAVPCPSRLSDPHRGYFSRVGLKQAY